MEWEGREESTNVEDQRGFSTGAGMAIGGAGTIILAILALIFGGNLQDLPRDQLEPAANVQNADPEEERMAKFSRVILHETEVVWDEQFRKMGKQYPKPVMRLYREGTKSGCGWADSAVGPFYCPADDHVYLDLTFFKDLESKFGEKGEFARAYVIAHEVGHHVQKQLGYSQRVDEARRTMPKAEYNRMSVRLELQADYLAGVWAHYSQRALKLTEKDIQSALHAAFEIGDDRLQKRARGRVVPDSFTHGTSKQRVRWFNEGYKTGDVDRARQLFDLRYDEL